MNRAVLEIVQSNSLVEDRGWYWHLKSRNGEVLCYSEIFTRREDAVRAAKTARKTMRLAKLAR